MPAVQADPDRLAWVVFQLVDNGIKFTPDGGHVTLGAQAESDAVAVWVRDTGIGIPPERRAELFEPFHQLDGSMTRRYSGTGLGLALVRLILDAHGAPIRVESVEGAGSTFRFALPAAPAP